MLRPSTDLIAESTATASQRALPRGRRSIRQAIAAGAVTAALALSLSWTLPATALADGGSEAADPAQAAASRTLAHAIESVMGPQSLSDLNAFAQDAVQTAQEQAHRQRVDAVLAEADRHQGAPYVYGGTTPAGFDCSGFTQYVFRTALGIELPRTAAAQAGVGESVSMDALEAGDLVFWGSGSGVYHVGIYVGDGSYIHAAGSGKGVRVQAMEWFHPDFAKRVI